MNTLPLEIENIILNMKNEMELLEHKTKMNIVFKSITIPTDTYDYIDDYLKYFHRREGMLASGRYNTSTPTGNLKWKVIHKNGKLLEITQHNENY